jgi:D-alanyl-D-alanine carboxypeptidase (penicillin-binding protein 5/6)
MKILYFLCAAPFLLWGKPLKVDVGAPSAVLMNADTGAVLYEKDIHRRCSPASITKIGTAIYVLEKKGTNLDGILTASSRALVTVSPHLRQADKSPHPSYYLETDGTHINIKPGEQLSLKTLLYGLMLSSGNDAANVLAEGTSGTIEQFMVELNRFFQEKGILETHFSNPHGLFYHDHWTTAYDMALMTKYALKNPAFREIVKTTKYLRAATNKNPAFYFIQHNRLVRPGPHFYPKAIGVKTGYVKKAKHTLVSAATHEGRTLIAVLLEGAEGPRFQDAIKLFEAAFAEKPVSRVLFSQGGETFSHEIKGGSSVLKAVLKDNLVLEYYPAEEPSFRAEIVWSNCKLPIQAHDTVGFLRVVDGMGKILKEQPLFAVDAVGQKGWSYVAHFCRTYQKMLLGIFMVGNIGLLLLYLMKKKQKVGEG